MLYFKLCISFSLQMNERIVISRRSHNECAINRERELQFDILFDVFNNTTSSSLFNYEHVSIIFNQIFNDASKIQVFANKRVLQNITSTTNNASSTRKSKTRDRRSIFMTQANARAIRDDIIANDVVDIEFKNRGEKLSKQSQNVFSRQSRASSRILLYSSRSSIAIVRFSRYLIRRAQCDEHALSRGDI